MSFTKSNAESEGRAGVEDEVEGEEAAPISSFISSSRFVARNLSHSSKSSFAAEQMRLKRRKTKISTIAISIMFEPNTALSLRRGGWILTQRTPFLRNLPQN